VTVAATQKISRLLQTCKENGNTPYSRAPTGRAPVRHKGQFVTSSSFSALGIAEPLMRALQSEGYTQPTPIQTQAIPTLLAGRDVLGLAQTGTGKTAAFALPLLQQLCVGHEGRRPRSVRALILAPTRELAVQIGDSLRIYGRHLHLRSVVVVGGMSQSVQAKSLAAGADILVATPGRLLDLENQKSVRLDMVRHLVLDEADRMLDMGFIRDVRKIIAKLPQSRQSALFSATMPTDVEALANSILRNPVRIDMSPPRRTAENIEQRVFHVSATQKRAVLSNLLGCPTMKRVLVFTRTKRGADRVAQHLEKAGVEADSIHGDKTQSARQRALERFRVGEARVLVATDIAARGIDIDDVTHVINFELPNEPESYVHRIGRTARAGANGIAISLCDESEIGYLRDIEKLTRTTVALAQGSPPERRPAPGRQIDHPARRQGRSRRQPRAHSRGFG
jgi:ATP-dependent RNA helicase RhlE